MNGISCIIRRSGEFASGLKAAGLLVLLLQYFITTTTTNVSAVDACFQVTWTTTITQRVSREVSHGRRLMRNALCAIQPDQKGKEGDPLQEVSNTKEDAIPFSTQQTAEKKKKKFVVVGGGWAGWGAAKALCESSLSPAGGGGDGNVNSLEVEVILLDTLPDPTGRTPFLSSTGKPVEAGTRGFWKDYPNINALCTQLGLDNVFTDFTNSSFYSPDGLEATSPVFGKAKFPETLFSWPGGGGGGGFSLPSPPFLAGASLENVPSPLGQVLASASLFERIPISDRASVVGFLLATIDCIGSLTDNDETIQKQYDRMTAHDLFIRFGMSPRLVRDIIKPLVLVCLFKPPEELSALVTLELFYFFTLAHMDSFDVRWIKNGTVADSITAPLATRLINEHNLQVLGGCRVGKITLADDHDDAHDSEKRGAKTAISSRPIRKKVSTVEYTRQDGTKEIIHDVHGVVLALTCRGMRAVISASKDLAKFPVFAQAASCEGIDVMSVRLWLDRIVPTRTPSNIFSRFDALRGAGGTFFMLDQLQNSNEALKRLWGKHGNNHDDAAAAAADDDDDDDDGDHPLGSVVACDFYNAGALLPLSDQDIVEILISDLLPAAVAEFANVQVVDSWVGRYPGAVSWFSPGTFEKRPPLQGAGSLALPNLKCAGDWVRLENLEYGIAKGLCQERAYASGLHAANSLLEDTVGRDTALNYQPHKVIPIRDDEGQFKASVALNKQVMKLLPRFWVR